MGCASRSASRPAPPATPSCSPASTVVIALLALNVTGIPFLGVMGTVGAACVAIAVLIALDIHARDARASIGERVLRGRERGRARSADGPAPAAPPVRPMSTRRAIGRVLLGVGLLGVLAIPAMSMRLGLPDGSSEAAGLDPVPRLHDRRREVRRGRERPAARRRRPPRVPDRGRGPRRPGPHRPAALRVSTTSSRSPRSARPPTAPRSPSRWSRRTARRASRPSSSSRSSGRPRRSTAASRSRVAGQASGNIDISQKLADALPLYLGARRRSVAADHGRRLPVAVRARDRDRRLHAVAASPPSAAVVAIYQWGWLGGDLRRPRHRARS